MLSVRSAIIAALFVFVVSVVAGTASLMGPPDSDGAAIDSYGTHRDGFRAVYELLSEFHVSVERRIEPPSADAPVSTTIVLWQPHEDLIANEPAYLRRLIPWIERGGRLVVSVAPQGRHELDAELNFRPDRKISSLWETLDLPDVSSITASFGDSHNSEESDQVQTAGDQRTAHREEVWRSMEKLIGFHKIEFTTVASSFTGSFESLKGRVDSLQIPLKQTGGLVVRAAEKPSGLLECQRPGGGSWILAAAFARGRGEIVVVAEPMLLMNASLGKSDNGVLAYDLLAPSGRPVIFDEFYHGLSVRGNPLWLLTKSTYAVAAVALLVLLTLELWRHAIMIGPPLSTHSKSRRTILEYIDAMARFLNRGRGSRPFLLTEIRHGTLRFLGEKLGLSPAAHEPETIAVVLSKRSPADADDFRQAMQMLDIALAKGHSLSESEAIRALQRISRCL